MLVKELLVEKGQEVFSVSPDETIFEAMKLMDEKEIGVLVVLDGEKMVGILSDRDYARKIMHNEKNPQDTRVKEIMTSQVVYTNPDEDEENCLSIMMDKRFRHMPVVDQGRVVGVISIGDIKSKI